MLGFFYTTQVNPERQPLQHNKLQSTLQMQIFVCRITAHINILLWCTPFIKAFYTHNCLTVHSWVNYAVWRASQDVLLMHHSCEKQDHLKQRRSFCRIQIVFRGKVQFMGKKQAWKVQETTRVCLFSTSSTVYTSSTLKSLLSHICCSTANTQPAADRLS